MLFTFAEDNYAAKIKVFGIGGGGTNAVRNMIRSDLKGVCFVAANTDAQALEVASADIKIPLGAEVTRGLGAGADPDKGRQAALESIDKIRETLAGSDMVFVTAGMGGGTGTGGAPIVAQIGKELGALTVAVVTKPFHFEGKKRMRQAEDGIRELKKHVDTIITIPNDRLLSLAEKNATFLEMLKKADDVLLYAVRGISDVITVPGLINVDFADVRTIMSEMGLALMGTGIASGENRAVEAAQKAISSPLLEDISISGARGVLINISCNQSLTMDEVYAASSLIQKEAHEDANIIFGSVLDDTLGDELRVTVIATGINTEEESEKDASPPQTVLPRLKPRTPETPARPWPGSRGPSSPPEGQTVERFQPRAILPGNSNLQRKRSFSDAVAMDEEELEVPTFLRRQAD
ncbi:MAG: cell division protein FtsZ [Thermodesulfobacteriota bacterium]